MFSPERQAGNTKIVGQAYTVEYARLDDPREKIAGHYVGLTLSYLRLLG
jgi:regulator of RNase E activity RraA